MIKVAKVIDKGSWEKIVGQKESSIFLQSWNFGQFHENLGNKIYRLGFWEGGKLEGVALLVKEMAKRGTYLTCPGGPVFDFKKEEFFDLFCKEAKLIAKTEGAVFLRVRPPIDGSQESRQLFQKKGFVDAPIHMHAETTWQLDLDKTEEELLRNMRKTTRYLVRKAEKLGVIIKKSQRPEEVLDLYKLQLETSRKQHFVPFSKDYLENQFSSFVQDDQAVLFKAFYQGQLVNIAMIIFYQDTAVYHYSGSKSGFEKVPSAYLLQWEAIKEAKRKGCKFYNFWGVTTSSDPGHRFAGVTLFKKGFGGYLKAYLHAQDLPFRRVYWIIYLFETLRRKWRHL